MAYAAEGLCSMSYVSSLVMKSFALSEMAAQQGSEKENFPARTFFIMS